MRCALQKSIFAEKVFSSASSARGAKLIFSALCKGGVGGDGGIDEYKETES